MTQILSLLVLLLVWISVNISPATALPNHPRLPQFTEEQLQAGDRLAEKAFAAAREGDLAGAENYWTELIEQFPHNPAVWSNRGNIRVSENKLPEAIADFNQAIVLAPDAPDPYLNRGIAWERMGKWSEAIADYNQVLELYPQDAAAFNNRGNAQAGLGEWQGAIADYLAAVKLAPDFALARANHALALYQTGQLAEAIQKLKFLARKYPQFPDVRAALTAALWVAGKRGEAESNWVAAAGLDSRYQNLSWVKNVRRWPPAMSAALEKFLKLQ